MVRLLEDMGVLPNLPFSSSSSISLAFRFVGVACTVPGWSFAFSVVDFVGVCSLPDSRSKSPRMRPSFWGVGPIEVGTAGLKSFRVEGVAKSGSSILIVRVFEGVSCGRVRLDGVCARGGSVLGFCNLAGFLGGGTLPERMSRTLLYFLYASAVYHSMLARECREGSTSLVPYQYPGWL